MSKGKVLITGISGFIAGHVARAALTAGYSVRGSVRNLNRADEVRDVLARSGADISALEFRALDLTKDDGWDDAMDGVDVLCHCASPFIAEIPKDPDVLIRPAEDGARRAVAAALKAGVGGIVLTSSFAAVGFGAAPKSSPYDGDDWTVSGGRGVTPYYESKLRAEQAAWSLADAAGARDRLTVINPALVLGPPLHRDLSTSVVLIRRMLRGELPMAPDYSVPVTDVRDVAALHVRAFPADLGGRRIVVGDDTLSMLDIAEALRDIAPKARLPRRIAPNFIVRLLAKVDRSVGSIADDLGVWREIDRGPAEAALRRGLIPAREAVRECARALKALGVV